MKDLSDLLPDPITALAPTSQEGGNMMSNSKLGSTAPGSEPVSPLPPAKEQADPKISASNSQQIRPGSGKRKPSTSYSAPKPAWTKTS